MPKLELDKIHLGDCLGYMKSLPAQVVDLVVSSPPYNLGKEYESRTALSTYLDGQREVLTECARLLKPGGSIFWQVGAYANSGTLIPLDIRLFPILEDLGLTPRNRIIWVRQHGLHARNKFSCRHETLLWFTKGDDYHFNMEEIRVPQKYQNKKHYRGDKKGELSCNPDGKNPGDIWVFRNVKQNHEEQTIHPCQFPEDLVSRIVLSVTCPGDVVMDPYAGVGSVAVVAKDFGRRYLGSEIDGDYHRVAIRRLAGEPDQHGCFPNLKTLRDYCEKKKLNPESFSFDTQVSKKATPRGQAKILPEHHHLDELERRLSYEELAFGAKIRGEEVPEDTNLNGKLNSQFYKSVLSNNPSKEMVQPLLTGLDLS